MQKLPTVFPFSTVSKNPGERDAQRHDNEESDVFEIGSTVSWTKPVGRLGWSFAWFCFSGDFLFWALIGFYSGFTGFLIGFYSGFHRFFGYFSGDFLSLGPY